MNADGTTKIASVSGNRNVAEALLKYEWKNFKFQGEYVSSKGPAITNNASPADPAASRNGWYTYVAYNFPLSNGMSIQPVVRYETYNQNVNLSNNKENVTTVGFNWYISKYVKFTTNYMWVNSGWRNLTTSSYLGGDSVYTNGNMWLSQLQFKF